MFYGGSISPPREPAKKKRVIPKKSAEKKMGDTGPSSRSGVKESSLVWLMLYRANYAEWVMIMQCNLQALEIWHAIDPGTGVKRAHDRQAMAALLCSVPCDMWQMLKHKKTVKEAWEAVETMRLGAEQVKEVKA
jgi:hypothetical protein